MQHGIIYTIITYSKTSGAFLSGGRLIMRWMDAKTSTLVLLLMSFLDPLDAYFAAAEGDAQVVDQSLLFRDAQGKEQEGRKLAAALNSGLLVGVSPEHFTGPRVYRHWTSAAAKHVTKVDILEESLGVAGGGSGGDAAGGATAAAQTTSGEALLDRGRVMELQSGHTPTTASSTYAGDAIFSIFSVNNALTFIYKKASSLWHASLGLASQHPRLGRLRHPIEPPSVEAAASGGGAGCARPPVPRRAAGGAAQAAAARRVSGAAHPAGPSAPESCSVGGGDAAVLALPDVFGDTRPLQSAHVRAQLARRHRLSKDDVAGAADAVSARLYGSSKYRSPTQREATYAVLSARDPVTQVVVLPTGGGKTSIFLVPALCESLAAVAAARDDAHAHGSACVSHIGAAPETEHGGAREGGLCVSDAPAAWYPPVTIVLTPTRAVTANTVEAATAAGLTVGEWPRGCDAGDASLFVMDICMIVQHAAVFLDLVRRLSLAGRLARIVIDEVHLVLLWSTFRDALAHVRAVLADLPCPLLQLTATLPRRWLNAVLAGVGLTSSRPWSFIGPPSTRRENIRYLVEAVPDGVRFYRNPAASVVGNRPLHAAVASRVLQQAGLMRSATGDRHGRSVVMDVFCKTVAEVDGIAAELAACLRGNGWGGGRHGVGSTSLHPTELDDVAILEFHPQGAAADGSSVPNCTSDSDTSRKEDV